MPEGPVHQAWLKSVWKELKALLNARTIAKPKALNDAKTPDPDNLQHGETNTYGYL